MSNSISKIEYRAPLQRGSAGVAILRVSRKIRSVVLRETHIVVNRSKGASKANFEALLDRVAPHLQAGGWHKIPCDTPSWLGVVFGGAESAVDAIAALGELKVCEEWASRQSREDRARWTHEGMAAQALGRRQSDQQAWALEHAYSL